MNKKDLIEEIRITKSSLNLLGYLLIILFCLLGGLLAWGILFVLEHLR